MLSRSYHWKTWVCQSEYLHQHNGGGETTVCICVFLFKIIIPNFFLKKICVELFVNVANSLTIKLTNQFPMNNLMDALGVCYLQYWLLDDVEKKLNDISC